MSQEKPQSNPEPMIEKKEGEAVDQKEKSPRGLWSQWRTSPRGSQVEQSSKELDQLKQVQIEQQIVASNQAKATQENADGVHGVLQRNLKMVADERKTTGESFKNGLKAVGNGLSWAVGGITYLITPSSQLGVEPMFGRSEPYEEMVANITSKVLRIKPVVSDSGEQQYQVTFGASDDEVERIHIRDKVEKLKQTVNMIRDPNVKDANVIPASKLEELLNAVH